MSNDFDGRGNYENSKALIGYISRKDAPPEIYSKLGFKCGLEIHQQLKTEKKLFCRCPAGIYQDGHDFDAELIRHMRPTLSELGEYDGTALMEFRTRKTIIYRIKDESACTYDIDDTPPFPINREALDITIEVALLLKTNIVGELHITRKQYLDGSIPTGFQRTAIIGIEGEIPLSNKNVRIIQISIEEDSCREVSDVGHLRTYTTDRLGIPLIEMVTYPDMKTPDEAAEAGQYLRFLTRSTGKMNTGIGAGREDVNVSITGGERVEIKGVAHIRWIPELTHNEAFRQRALLEIMKILKERIKKPGDWKIESVNMNLNHISPDSAPHREARSRNCRLAGVNLPQFKGLLSFFTQPGKMFADEISDRLKVVACLEKPNMIHSETFEPFSGVDPLGEDDWSAVRKLLKAGNNDGQIILWGPEEDIETALETIEERCRLAFEGVPNETRKSFPDGTTIFERVLPGPDRMYPDTDSAPIPIDDEKIEEIGKGLPDEVDHRLDQLRKWDVPEDTYHYLLKRNLVWIIQKIVEDFNQPAKFVGTLFGHTLRHIEARVTPAAEFSYYTIYGLFKFLHGRKLERTIAVEMLPELYAHPKMVFESVLTTIGYKRSGKDEILSHVAALRKKFAEIRKSSSSRAEIDWIMGNLRKIAVGNIPLSELSADLEKEINHD
jgi:glutamyl-tRNA(Gln) amidotransferase subunit E